MQWASRGFTLLEVLVATALFAVIGALSWGGLNSLARARAALVEQTDQLAHLQRAIGRLERDLRQAVDRSVRVEDGSRRPAFLGSAQGFESTRLALPGGWQNPRPAVERLAWRCRGGRLERLRWAVPDRTAGTALDVEVVLEVVSDCRWRYLARRPLAEWPGPDQPPLPRAVEFSFQHADAGVYRRVLELPANAGPWQ